MANYKEIDDAYCTQIKVIQSHMPEVARLYHQFYIELVRVGFTEQQAVTIVSQLTLA